MMQQGVNKRSLVGVATALAVMLTLAISQPGDAGAGGSIQALGGWWTAGDSGSTYGLGLRGSIGDTFGLDVGWMSYGEGDEIGFDVPGNDEEVNFGGVKANVFDLGLRYTFPVEIYIGGGASYYDFDHTLDSIDGEWGAYGLVGWSFGGENLRGFVEGMYRYTNGKLKFQDDRFLYSIEQDFDQDGLGVNLGVMYRF